MRNIVRNGKNTIYSSNLHHYYGSLFGNLLEAQLVLDKVDDSINLLRERKRSHKRDAQKGHNILLGHVSISTTLSDRIHYLRGIT